METPTTSTESKVTADDRCPQSDLEQCIRTLESLVENRRLLANLDQEGRKRLMIAAGLVAKPDRHSITKLAKELRLRKRKKSAEQDILTKENTAIRAARTAAVFSAPELDQRMLESAAPTEHVLGRDHSCYVCKKDYRRLHFFYDSMCEDCGQFNYQKRFQTADVRGRVALITGARVKIGYHVALMLLRGGATVIVTTRFPHNAAKRYAQEKDAAEWSDRLHVFGLDLRHAPSVEIFAQLIAERFERLDFLINNAAQTVRRPRGFYSHMMDEEDVAPECHIATRVLAMHTAGKEYLSAKTQSLAPGQAEAGILSYAKGKASSIAPGLTASAQLSQMPVLPDDLIQSAEIFPTGKLDADLQQVDLRATNSWRMRLADVPTAELLEIQLINAVAPFILCSKLKPLMLRSPGRDKHIVNVSAMEGKFTRYTKTDKHPHTNMAKAALNMMTQTSAPDYARDGIHINAVDTGWVTDEDPAIHATRKKTELGFQPPLDIVDGAARIMDPIFQGLNSGEHVFGLFLKDYKPTAW